MEIMEYRLNALKNIQDIIIKRFNTKDFFCQSVEYVNLSGLVKRENTILFGLLTLGSNVDKCVIFDDDREIIEIGKNTQIVEYFSHLKYYDSLGTEILKDVKGHFRGYEIFI